MKKTLHNKMLKPLNNQNEPCAPCVPVSAKAVSLQETEFSELVKREVMKQLASLPFYQVQCIDVKKAAELLDCFPDTVRQYIRRGQLPAAKIGNDYRIRLTDLEAFLLSSHAKVINMRKRRKAS